MCREKWGGGGKGGHFHISRLFILSCLFTSVVRERGFDLFVNNLSFLWINFIHRNDKLFTNFSIKQCCGSNFPRIWNYYFGSRSCKNERAGKKCFSSFRLLGSGRRDQQKFSLSLALTVQKSQVDCSFKSRLYFVFGTGTCFINSFVDIRPIQRKLNSFSFLI